MSLIVKKFGGTSLSSVGKIKNIAKHIADNSKNNRIIVVLSAMGKSISEKFDANVFKYAFL